MRNKRRDLPAIATIREIHERSRRVFAIGDIHGCLDELDALLCSLRRDHGAATDDHYVFIGDYIDRGPNSRGVVDRLLAFKKECSHCVFLRGNHEDMLLGFLGLGGHAGEVYLTNGGVETFKSYGVEPNGPISQIVEQLPKEHIDFYTATELGVVIAEFLFVHAGVSPNSPLTQQREHDLMWVRGEFIQSQHDLGKTVVFGHTPFEDVMLHLPYKIGIDTGLVYGNRLTAIELVEGTLFQVDKGDKEVLVSSLRDRLASGSD